MGGHGGVRPAPREACRLRLLRPLFGAWDAGAAAGLRRAALHPFPVAPSLPVARTRSYAAVGTERHLQRGQVATRGALLLGLGACGQPLVFAYETLPGEDFYLSGATVLLLGWPSGGINLPEATLFALLALLLLRGAHQRALNKLWEGIARENQEKARRLYEEGLGRGDLSLLKGMASEDFRDLRHGERGEKGMERVVLRLRESFPDLEVSVDAQEVERDLVSTRLTISGTDRGKGVMWYPPTGRRVSVSAEFVDRFSRDGQLVEHDGSTDTEGLLRQLGYFEEDRPDCGPYPSEPIADGPA